MNEPKVSIIVPVYNVEKYLPKCIESILAQTFTDFELLLIDDGSPDSSGKICDKYAAEDSRIRVFHKPNGGVSSARNFGIDNAKGEWIMFVDADDTILDICLEICFDILRKNNIDLLQFQHNQTLEYDENKKIYNLPINMRDYIRFYHPVCIGGAMFKAQIIKSNSIKFRNSLKLGEDQLFIYDFISKASKLMYINKKLYFYRYNENSATNSMTYASIVDSIKVLKDYKTEHKIVSFKLDGIILDLYFKKIVFDNLKFKELIKFYEGLYIGKSIKTRSFSTLMYHKLSLVSIPLAIIFGKLYFSAK